MDRTLGAVEICGKCGKEVDTFLFINNTRPRSCVECIERSDLDCGMSFTNAHAILKVQNARRDICLYKCGRTEEWYLRVFIDQKGLCGICLCPPTSRGLYVDHCHVTHLGRGLLCGTCNTLISVFKDDPTRLRAFAHCWVPGIWKSKKEHNPSLFLAAATYIERSRR